MGVVGREAADFFQIPDFPFDEITVWEDSNVSGNAILTSKVYELHDPGRKLISTLTRVAS